MFWAFYCDLKLPFLQFTCGQLSRIHCGISHLTNCFLSLCFDYSHVLLYLTGCFQKCENWFVFDFIQWFLQIIFTIHVLLFPKPGIGNTSSHRWIFDLLLTQSTCIASSRIWQWRSHWINYGGKKLLNDYLLSRDDDWLLSLFCFLFFWDDHLSSIERNDLPLIKVP